MNLKKALLLFVIVAFCRERVLAQDDDFCDAVTTILKDAPNKFKNTRGNLLSNNVGATTWACGIKVPGTINSRFVLSMGLFYEGGFFQSKNKEELKTAYERVKNQLTNCLSGRGYTESLLPNFFPGLDSYKKVLFTLETAGDMAPANAPPHLSMEATYNKDVGFYTVVLYIFEH